MRLERVDDLPDAARVWIFGTDRPLAAPETRTLFDAVDAFLDAWKAHGVPLTAARDWRHDRFLVVAVDEETAPPSGCSIDALVRVLQGLEGELDVRFLGNEAVWYRDATGVIERASRPEFRALAGAGRVTPQVVVFDNSLTRLAELRAGRWEGPAQDRWHGPAFFGAADRT